MSKINVFLQGEGFKDIAHLQLESHSNIMELKHSCENHGLQLHHETAVFLENQDEPLTENVTIESLACDHGIRLHVHRCRRVAITVIYCGQVVENTFGPGKTVGSVKEWAATSLGITHADAAELILQIADSHVQPDVDVHIGALAKYPDCSIGFDLVPNSRIQGAM